MTAAHFFLLHHPVATTARLRHWALVACLGLSAPLGAQASETLCPGWSEPSADQGGTAPRLRHEAFFSPYTHHWRYSDDHRQVVAFSLSRRLPGDRFCGASLFSNSFGQPSAYAFVGKTWPGLVPGLPRLYASATAGIIYGYVGEHKDKVPLNVGGFSPVVIPAVGYRLSEQAAVEVQLLGTAAVMVGTSWRF
ncbi:hypothetical protein [Macromonas nakdongensis]|uniref:hypothetical protein n=1 Tax=Macromonas nakdongensis TaxID=1843082 RepID=UPI001E2A10B5|nr:hypothetical protein [Macromonas nakdongensis]